MLPPNLYARVQHIYAQTAHGTAGAARTRSSLRPRISRADKMQTSGKSCRENEDTHLVAREEVTPRAPYWIVVPANAGTHTPRLRDGALTAVTFLNNR